MADDIYHREGTVMGGPWQIRIVRKFGLDCDAAAQAGLAAMERVNAQMSTYQSSSDLMRINHAPEGAWVPIPHDLCTVLREAEDIARLTDGALNVALGGLVNAWGFGPDPVPRHAPDAAQQRADDARAALGSFALRASPPAVLKTAPVQLDLCALAKGFAVDQAAAALRAAGAGAFLVEAAGEVYATGHRPDGTAWTVGLELPVPGRRIVYDRVPLADCGLATSGQYRNRRDVGGQGYGHTISPCTGQPLDTDLLSVTVCAPAVMRADAMATALLVMGPAQGPGFAAEHGIAAQFVCRTSDGAKIITSAAWANAAQPALAAV